MATKQVEIPGIGTVMIYRRHGNRSLRLSIASNGEVRVSMPSWLPYKAGEKFAYSKIDWITSNRMPQPELLRHGQPIGKGHRLYFVKSFETTKVSTRLKQGQIEVVHPAGLNPDDQAVQKAAHSAGIRALRKEAEQLLPYRLKQLAERSGFTYQNVGVKQLKGRWGSCSSQQEIVLNLFLMQLPWHLIDYVLFHELTHTKVMQHGAPFWQELERHVPDAKLLRKEIANHHPVLVAGLS
ncbi:MAG TPA: SprT family zinc-dependent metalloprotease [Patescibacteria group bacterium]|nr:SprT family zinc-dependent metalloprotease [Patescibacteria group bacterium]